MATEFWDKFWKTESDSELAYWKQPDQAVLELIAAQSPKQRPKVLDLGCGLGRHAIAFAKAGFSVTATDASRTAIAHLDQWSKNTSLKIQTKTCDVLTDGFGEKSFDIVVSYNVIYHSHREQFEQAIEHVRNLLKDKGLFFFTCPSRQDGKYGHGQQVATHTFLATKSITPGHIHYFTSNSDLDELLASFKILSQQKQEGYWDNKGSQQFYSNWNILAEKQ